MKYVLIIVAKFIFGTISFRGGFFGAIFGLFMIGWGIYDVITLLGVA